MTPIVAEPAVLSLESGAVMPMSVDLDDSRGRRRDRSQPRASASSLRTDESSTLRGRSRHRAVSPHTQSSRTSTLSSTRQLLLQNRLRDTRREHCPSRKQSPSGQSILMRRQRSRSRTRTSQFELDVYRPSDHTSSLRREVFMDAEVAAEAQVA
jgi:hypothetical protein